MTTNATTVADYVREINVVADETRPYEVMNRDVYSMRRALSRLRAPAKGRK